jgi:hypothetical protein
MNYTLTLIGTMLLRLRPKDTSPCGSGSPTLVGSITDPDDFLPDTDLTVFKLI